MFHTDWHGIRYAFIGFCWFCLSGWNTWAQDVSVLYQRGQILLQEGEQFVPRDESTAIPQTKTLKIETLPTESGQIEDAELQIGEQIFPALDKAFAVLSYSKREVMTLSKGATVSRKLNQYRIPVYSVTGVGHFLISESETEPSVELIINGIQIESSRAHLFFNGLKSPPELIVLEGDVQIQDTGVRLSAVGPSPDEKAQAPPPIPNFLTKAPQETHSLIELSSVPGFTHTGPYRYAGKAEFDKAPLIVTRFGSQTRFDISPISLMVQDQIETGSDQKVFISLISGDRITLFPKSRFIIQEFNEEKIAPKTFFGRLFGGEKRQFALAADVLGKMRAVIQPRSRKGSVNFKAPTAVIGVKGTEFEVAATEGETEVMTLEGLVGVADADGNDEIEVTEGMMTTVRAGEPPSEPERIPPGKLAGPEPAFISNPPEEVLPEEEETIDVPEERDESQPIQSKLSWFPKRRAALAPARVYGPMRKSKSTMLFNAVEKELATYFYLFPQTDYVTAKTQVVRSDEVQDKACITSECLEMVKKQLKTRRLFTFDIIDELGVTRLNLSLLGSKKVYTTSCTFCDDKKLKHHLHYLVLRLLEDRYPRSEEEEATGDQGDINIFGFTGLNVAGTVTTSIGEATLEAGGATMSYFYIAPSHYFAEIQLTSINGTIRQNTQDSATEELNENMMEDSDLFNYSRSSFGWGVGYSFQPGPFLILPEIMLGMGNISLSQEFSGIESVWEGTLFLAGFDMPVLIKMGNLVLGVRASAHHVSSTINSYTVNGNKVEDVGMDSLTEDSSTVGVMLGFAW